MIPVLDTASFKYKHTLCQRYFDTCGAWTNTWRGVNAQKNGYPGVLPGSIVLVDGMPNKKTADSAFGDGHDLQGCMIRCQADWSAIDGANDNLLKEFVRSYVKALGSPTSKHDPAEVIEEIIGRISEYLDESNRVDC